MSESLRRWTTLSYYVALAAVSALVAACKGETTGEPHSAANASPPKPSAGAAAVTRDAATDALTPDAGPDAPSARPDSGRPRRSQTPSKAEPKGKLWDITLE